MRSRIAAGHYSQFFAVDAMAQLFIVAKVNVIDRKEFEPLTEGWTMTRTLNVLGERDAPYLMLYSLTIICVGSEHDITIRVQAAEGSRCNRCWSHTAPKDESICGRCAQALAT